MKVGSLVIVAKTRVGVIIGLNGYNACVLWYDLITTSHAYGFVRQAIRMGTWEIIE